MNTGNLKIISQEKVTINGNDAFTLTNAQGKFSRNGVDFERSISEVIIYDNEKFYTLHMQME